MGWVWMRWKRRGDAGIRRKEKGSAGVGGTQKEVLKIGVTVAVRRSPGMEDFELTILTIAPSYWVFRGTLPLSLFPKYPGEDLGSFFLLLFLFYSFYDRGGGQMEGNMFVSNAKRLFSFCLYNGRFPVHKGSWWSRIRLERLASFSHWRVNSRYHFFPYSLRIEIKWKTQGDQEKTRMNK